jgi:hypothetical protein
MSTRTRPTGYRNFGRRLRDIPSLFDEELHRSALPGAPTVSDR